jgi:hypothetical protein
VVELHNAGEKNGIATAIMEHASALVNLAGALYVGRRYGEARDAYSQSLEVFELVGDGDKIAKALVNLANLHELQVGGFFVAVALWGVQGAGEAGPGAC